MKKNILKQEKNENENYIPRRIARCGVGLGVLAFAGVVAGAGMAIAGNIAGAESLLKNGLTVLTASGITAAVSFIGTAGYALCAVSGEMSRMEEMGLFTKPENEKNEEPLVENETTIIDFKPNLEK